MIKALLPVALIAALGGGAAVAVRPAVAVDVTGGASVAPDSSVVLATAVFLHGTWAGDTVVFRYYRNDSLLTARRWVRTWDSLKTVAAPAYGATAVYKGCAQIERGGRTSGLKYPATQVCWSWSYARPIPDPVIDSVKQIVLRPGAADLATNTTRQFCVFGVLASGRRVKLSPSWNIPECETAYQSWLAEKSA